MFGRQIFQETDAKRLVYDSNAAGNKYFVYTKIDFGNYHTWELYGSYGTHGEAMKVYDQIYDGVTERDFDEWMVMKFR